MALDKVECDFVDGLEIGETGNLFILQVLSRCLIVLFWDNRYIYPFIFFLLVLTDVKHSGTVCFIQRLHLLQNGWFHAGGIQATSD